MTPSPATAPSPATPARRLGLPVAADVTLSIVFLVVGAILVGVLFVPGLFLAMASDGCTNNCAIEQVGFYWAIITPAVAWFATLVATIVLLAIKRAGWLFSLLGIAAVLVTFMVGVALVFVPLP